MKEHEVSVTMLIREQGTSCSDLPRKSRRSELVAELRDILGLLESSSNVTVKKVVLDSIASFAQTSSRSPNLIRKKSYKVQPPGRSFWTKCPQCGYLQALDQGAWARVGSFLIYCCASCAYHQLITGSLVNFGRLDHVDPAIDVVECEQCRDHVMLVMLSGARECLNCMQHGAEENDSGSIGVTFQENEGD